MVRAQANKKKYQSYPGEPIVIKALHGLTWGGYDGNEEFGWQDPCKVRAISGL